MDNCEKTNTVKPIDIEVVSSTPATLGSVIITIPEVFLQDGCFLNMIFCLSKPDLVRFRNLIVGTEVVTIRNGVDGTQYVMEDNTADIFYSGLLKLGYCYRLKWGNNGPANSVGTAGGVAHFYNCNTPYCERKFNPANTAIPTPIPVGV